MLAEGYFLYEWNIHLNILLMQKIKSLKCINAWSEVTRIAHQTDPVNYFVCSICTFSFLLSLSVVKSKQDKEHCCYCKKLTEREKEPTEWKQSWNRIGSRYKQSFYGKWHLWNFLVMGEIIYFTPKSEAAIYLLIQCSDLTKLNCK